MSLIASLILIAASRLVPGHTASKDVLRLVERIDFHEVLWNGILLFLLFAAAIQVEWSEELASKTQ